MSVVRWGRAEALGADPLAVDELDGVDVLLVEGLDAGDAPGWLGRAPTVVVAPGGDVDPDDVEVDAVVAAVEANPLASRVLVDVLRAVEHLDVERGLVVESLAYSLLLTGAEHARWRAAQPPRAAKELGDPLRVERVGHDLVITLARPGNRNAFGAAVRDALVEALWLAELDDEVHRVELRGEGPTFCAGGDLTEFGLADDAVRAHEVRTLRSVGAVLARIAPRVTALVQGDCVGAGVELSAFASHVVADPGATFRLPEVSMGLVPGAGGTVSVSRRVGRRRAARLALLGDAVDAATALSWGLVDEIAEG